MLKSWGGKWRGKKRSSSCSQRSLWDFFTLILLISLSWYLLRATLFYWDFIGGEMFYIIEKRRGGCYGTNGGLFTKGAVNGWVWLYRWCQQGQNELLVAAVVSLQHLERQHAVNTDIWSPLSLLLLLLSQRAPFSVLFPHISLQRIGCTRFLCDCEYSCQSSHFTSTSLGRRKFVKEITAK